MNYEERWKRFDEAIRVLRSLWSDDRVSFTGRFYSTAGIDLEPKPVQRPSPPIWIGSWGSKAGLRRVARLGDGWLASAYNTTPEAFSAARESLSHELRTRGRDPDRFPNALVTMWTWITSDARDADRVLRDVLAPLLGRDPDALRDQLC